MTTDHPPCTCLGLPMGPDQTCDAHQLPAAAKCSCPQSFMRQRRHHPSCSVQPASDVGPSVAEAAADDRRWPLEKHGEQ